MYEGYSEVGIVIRKKDEEHYWKKAKAWDKKYGFGEDTVKALLFFARKRTVYSEYLKKDCIVFHWPKISWRPEYKSISFFKQCFQNEEDRYDFLRIGEDDPADFEVKMYLGSGILSYYTERHMIIKKDSKKKERN